ncbi:MAG: type II toxin-antitoxin system death-on-curing family toxin [Sumerlaeia bacterium]
MSEAASNFLDLADVLQIHAHQIRTYGGEYGVRDQGLLLSALAQPQATFDRIYLHQTLHAQAAAYLFHLVENHPFVDGNKRTGAACAMVFLELNGLRLIAKGEDF